MAIVEIIFIKIVLILFPLFCYFLFVSGNIFISKKANVIFDIALFSSIYLVLKYETQYYSIDAMLLVIPLLIAYLKNKLIAAYILSFVLIIIFINTFNLSVILVIIEFIIYFLWSLLLKKKYIKERLMIIIFVTIKIIFIIIELDKFIIMHKPIEFIILLLLFYITTHLIMFLIKSAENNMNLHLTIKQLEKQKQLRDSIFKISHEIKNPIAVCKGYLDMFDGNNKDHVNRYIPILKQEIERTLMLLNDFLMFTKIQIDKQRMDLALLIQDVYETNDFILKRRNIFIKCNCITEEVYIYGDYDRLKQVFINIIKNAAEAINNKEDGIIILDGEIINGEVIISVSDNGIGMNVEVLSRLGEAFYTTKKSGTGLGVKFSQEIIEAHGGSITYSSNLNKGTTVTIKLPIEKSL